MTTSRVRRCKNPIAFFDALERRALFAVAGTTLGVDHTPAAVNAELAAYHAAYPAITQLVDIGTSVQGRPILGLEITNHPGVKEDEPELLYVGMIHADETPGLSNSLYFIDHLLENYGTDARVTALVNTTDLWIFPVINPDGLGADDRLNANDIDLNRDFPEGGTPGYGFGNRFDGPAADIAGLEPEVEAVINFRLAHNFTAAATFHAGSLLVNYPYDNNGDFEDDYATAPDDALFREISLVYSRENAPMFASADFPQGISNGDEWYSIAGGMQDWALRYTGSHDVTIELSEIKHPAESALPGLWQDNEESMMRFAEAVHFGVRGVVTRSSDDKPVFARVRIEGIDQDNYTSPIGGDYHRQLVAGTYNFTVSAPGYTSKTFSSLIVGGDSFTAAETARVDVVLNPLDGNAPTIVKKQFRLDHTKPRVVFRANEAVGDSIAAGNVTIERAADGVRFNKLKIASSYDPATDTASFSLGPSLNLPDGNYVAILKAARVRDVWGNALANNARVSFFYLNGDVNHDRVVDSTDFTQVVALQGATGSPGYASGNVNSDTTIDAADLAVVTGRFGNRVEADAAAVVQPASIATSSAVMTASAKFAKLDNDALRGVLAVL